MKKPKTVLKHGGKLTTVVVEFEVESPKRLTVKDAKAIETVMRGEFSDMVIDVIHDALPEPSLWVHTENDLDAANTLRVGVRR
jgi:hypothetical protein